MNIYQNNGKRAGQSEPHFHVHVVPRYEHGDPHRIFEQHECQLLSLEEQRLVAALIGAEL
jgi:diadenosine tetraphosphate (Ap4A) HIT family hydrolase